MRFSHFVAALALLTATGGVADAQQGTLGPASQEYHSMPYRQLICTQRGQTILQQSNLTDVLVWRNSTGVLVHIEFRRAPADWNAVDIAADTTCMIDVQG